MMLAATAARVCARRPPAAAALLRVPRAAAPLLRCPGRAQRHATVAAASADRPEYCVLEYEYTHHDAELLAKREPYLEDHLKQCRHMADQGKLLLWGAVGSPITGGMLIWRNANEDEVKAFVKSDPFVVNGLVRHWTIRPFHVHVVDAK